MTRQQIPTGLYAIGWLFALHGLANIFVGVFRVVDLHRPATDVLAAAFPRAQVCLLVIWLMLGKERLSWRVCGLIAGCSYIFMLYSRFLFPGEYGVGHGTAWMGEEWTFYFRLSGPGDWLVRLPILVGGIAVPLAVRKVWRASWEMRKAGFSWGKLANWFRFQFRFQDVAIWTLTTCLALAALYQTAPYSGWLQEVTRRCHEIHQSDVVDDNLTGYAIESAVMQAFVGLVSLWAIYSKTWWWFRLPVTVALVVGPAYAFERLLKRILADPEWSSGQWAVLGQASAETWTTTLMAATMIVSILLFRLYETLSRTGGYAPESGSLT